MNPRKRALVILVVGLGVLFFKCAAQTKTTLDVSDKVEPVQKTQQQITAGKNVKTTTSQDTKTGWSGAEVLMVVGSLVLLMLVWDIARDYGPALVKRLAGRSP